MLPRFHFSRFFLARFLGGSPKSPPRFYYPRFCFLFCFKSARRWKYKAFPPPTSALVWALSLDRSTIHARCPIAPGIVALLAFVCNLITVPRGAVRAFNSREMRFPAFLRYRFLQEIDTYPKSPKRRQAHHRLPGVLWLSHPVSQ